MTTTQTPKQVRMLLALLEQKSDWVDGVLSLGNRMDFLNQEEAEELNRLVPPNSVTTEKNIQYVLIEATDSPSKIIEEAEAAGMKTTNLVEVICLIAEGGHRIPDKLYGEGQGDNEFPLIVATDCRSNYLYCAMVGDDSGDKVLCFRYDKHEPVAHNERIWLLFRDGGTSTR